MPHTECSIQHDTATVVGGYYWRALWAYGKRAVLFGGVILGLCACTSPEAVRTRGGGPGADVGIRDAVVELHAGAQPLSHALPHDCRVSGLAPLGADRPPDTVGSNMVSAHWDDIQTRLAALQQQYAAWQSVLTLWEESLKALDDPLWQAVVPQPCADRPAAAPLLAGVTITVEARRVQRWVNHLVTVNGKHATADTPALVKGHFNQEQALALLEAALCQDQTRLASLAIVLGVSPHALARLAHLAVLPLLQACGQCLTPQVPLTWSHTYCPICGAWPALVEVRGLEQARRLRCARCGADWHTAWLRCAYCGEGDHKRLGVLRPEAEGETRTVETCATCQGYLKTQATLQALPAYAVALTDLATVALDMATLERGFARPSRPGYALASCLTARPGRLRPMFGWRK